MSANQRYSSDNPRWFSEEEHRRQFMLMQPAPHDIADTYRSDHSWPSQLYHSREASLNLPNPRDEHHQQITSPTLNLNQDEDDGDDHEDSSQNPTTQDHRHSAADRQDAIPIPEEKESMFEKQLTPSDVGKLNRLVIPKQHAEKYFPVSGDTAEHKGLVLSFEDEWGKCWRFRYSYWNSSQSYVLTKGWSRYVKEKRLDAGDFVLFERDPNDSERLFICCKQRRQHSESVVSVAADNVDIHTIRSNAGVGMTRAFYPAHPYPTRHPPLPNEPECLHAGRGSQIHGRKKSVGSSSSKVLRLFGVNMECQPENRSEVPPPSMSSYASSIHLHYDYEQPSYHPQTTHEHTVRQRQIAKQTLHL